MIANPIKFNQFDFSAFDNRAKFAAQTYLKDRGFEIIENSDKYGVDFFAKKKDIIYPIEVEIKRKFVTFDSLDEYIHIPERKRKFFILPNNVFMLFNVNANLLIMISGGKIINHAKVIEKVTSRSSIPDKFFEIHIKHFLRREL